MTKIQINLLPLKKLNKKKMFKNQIISLQEKIKKQIPNNCNDTVLNNAITFYDATTLNTTDSHASVIEFTKHIMQNYPNVASICVSPKFIEDVGLTLGENPINITTTIGAFPMGQTYLEVKILECSMAIENGADEVDFIINVSAINNEEWEKAKSEIIEFINEIDQMAVSKVILECAALKDIDTVYKASTIALEAGVDFIKTSTGKHKENVKLDSVIAMCIAIKDFHEKTGCKKGIKIAGGVNSLEDVAMYYTTVKEILGEQWLTPKLFRIGTSQLVK